VAVRHIRPMTKVASNRQTYLHTRFALVASSGTLRNSEFMLGIARANITVVLPCQFSRKHRRENLPACSVEFNDRDRGGPR
jgi:hypothetical protein